MNSDATVNIPVKKISGNDMRSAHDLAAREEPLEISIRTGTTASKKNISVTMRTPGADQELSVGFLFTEGIIRSMADLDPSSIPVSIDNRIEIHLRPEVNLDPEKLQRHFYTSSSCGVCGKTSVEAVRNVLSIPESSNPFPVDAEMLKALPARLLEHQRVFEQTGGLHASALFDDAGRLITLREDVGRHNALDKLIGHALLQNMLPLDRHILLLSGRASFELLQKSAVAGISVVASIGAPSSLAIELAADCGIALIGFLRSDRFNIYTGAERIFIGQPVSK